MIKIRVELEVGSEEKAKQVLLSLSPDNVQIPADLSINVEQTESKLIINLASKNLRRLRSTLEELLSLVSAIEKL